LLPAQLADSMLLACCKIDKQYPEGVLTANEKVELNSFQSSVRRREYLATRWLIKQMMQHMNLDPEQFVIHKTDEGQPFGQINHKNYHLSIAHTNYWAACGISPVLPVGIDLEQQNRTVSDRLRDRMLTSDEQHLLAKVDTLQLWTIKESVLKLYGQGLRTDLKDCAITSRDRKLFMAKCDAKNYAKVYSFSHQNNWFAVANKFSGSPQKHESTKI
jgi:phosphopantetheinyl transferase